MASGARPGVYAAAVSAGEEGAVVWVLLDPEDGARTRVLEALEATPDLVPEARPWPSRKERATPAAVVVRGRSSERLMALKHRLGGAKAVVLAAPDTSREDARAVISQGADAVLLDEDVPELVASAVRAAIDGLLVLSSPLGAAVERPPLTPREKQILALVVMGYTNREIADQLVLAESTVKSHLFSAFRRLGVRSRSEAVALITDPTRGLGSGILTIARE